MKELALKEMMYLYKRGKREIEILREEGLIDKDTAVEMETRIEQSYKEYFQSESAP